MKKATLFISGILIGILNVLFGAGAGIVAVMLLKKQGLSQKQAQANALAVILPVTAVSLIIYFLKGYVNFYGNIFLIAASVTGALAGTFIFKKINSRQAKTMLGFFTVFAGIRLLMKS